MENKVIISCPICNKQCRIPSNKHIKFTCPNCKNIIEYDSRNNQNNSDNIEGSSFVNENDKSNFQNIPQNNNTKNEKKSFKFLNTLLTGIIAYLIYHFVFHPIFFTNKETPPAKETYKESFNETNKITYEDKTLEKLKNAMDINNKTTRKFAVSLASTFPGEFNFKQICIIYDYLRNNWKYISDSRGIDYFAKASESIDVGLKGDCDDFAILMATLIEQIGGKTRIVTAFNKNKNIGHAYAEVKIAKKERMHEYLEEINNLYSSFFYDLFGLEVVDNIHYSVDKYGMAWLNLDWTSEYPGGPYYESDSRVIYYPIENKYEIE